MTHTKIKKFLIFIAIFLILAVFVFALGCGFRKCTSPYLADYQSSSDGQTITLQVRPASSIGYLRNMKVHNENNRVSLTFYHTFGGLNSSLGAKDTFSLTVPENCNEIYFDCGKSGQKLVLVKPADSSPWQLPANPS